MNLQQALLVITDEMKNDPSYFEIWKANIAMAFKDEYANKAINAPYEHLYCPTTDDIHKIANQAATNFLNKFIK